MSNFYGGVNQPVKIPRSGSSFHFSYLILLFLGVLISGFGCSPQAAHNIVRDEYPLPEGVEIVPAPESVGEYGGIFIESGGGDPKTFNPLLVEDAGSADAVGKLSSGLVAWDPVRQESVPGLAERWEVSEDNRTFTFYLRKGVLWSDGTPFTADDIEFTFQAIYDPRYPNRNAYDISLDGEPFKVEKIDEYTIRITAPDVFAPFLQKIGVFTLPKHILYEAWKNGTLANEWGLNTAINNPEKLVSLGPYILYSYRPGERMVFIPNPHYYRADTEGKRLPYIDYYITTLSGDSKAAELAFAHGQTDIHGITPDSLGWIEPFAEPQDFTIYDRGPSTTSSFIWFNLNPGTQPDGRPFVDPKKRAWFEDVRFRQAVSYGINREAIIRGVLFGRGTPLYGPESPANTRWYNSNIKTYPYNPERARALLKEAGFHWNRQGQLLDAQNNRVEFTLITNEENALRRQITLIFQQNMEELGIQVQLRFLDFNTLVGRIADSYNYEACLLGLTGGNGDPSGGISVFHSRGRLHQWHPAQESPARDWEAEIDELMIAQLKTLDFEERRKAWFRVQEIMSEQVPYIYLVTPNTYVGIKNRWKNLELPSMGSPIWNLDLWWSISR